jgi:hypothetical protein
MLNKDAMRLGMWLACFACTLSWNFELPRYIKRNLYIDPPHSTLLKLVVRVFLVVFTLGTFSGLVEELSRGVRPIKFYGAALATR